MTIYTPLPELLDGHAHSHRWRKLAKAGEAVTREARDSVAKLSKLATYRKQRNVLAVIDARLRSLEAIWQQAK